jgi:hypothetical protein
MFSECHNTAKPVFLVSKSNHKVHMLVAKCHPRLSTLSEPPTMISPHNLLEHHYVRVIRCRRKFGSFIELPSEAATPIWTNWVTISRLWFMVQFLGRHIHMGHPVLFAAIAHGVRHLESCAACVHVIMRTYDETFFAHTVNPKGHRSNVPLTSCNRLSTYIHISLLS